MAYVVHEIECILNFLVIMACLLMKRQDKETRKDANTLVNSQLICQQKLSFEQNLDVTSSFSSEAFCLQTSEQETCAIFRIQCTEISVILTSFSYTDLCNKGSLNYFESFFTG